MLKKLFKKQLKTYHIKYELECFVEASNETEAIEKYVDGRYKWSEEFENVSIQEIDKNKIKEKK